MMAGHKAPAEPKPTAGRPDVKALHLAETVAGKRPQRHAAQRRSIAAACQQQLAAGRGIGAGESGQLRGKALEGEIDAKPSGIIGKKRGGGGDVGG
jgi:hypothetical protein